MLSPCPQGAGLRRERDDSFRPPTAARGAPLSYQGPLLQIQTIQTDKEAKVPGHDSPREQAQPAGQSEGGWEPRGLGSSLSSSQAKLSDPEAAAQPLALEWGEGAVAREVPRSESQDWRPASREREGHRKEDIATHPWLHSVLTFLYLGLLVCEAGMIIPASRDNVA